MEGERIKLQEYVVPFCVKSPRAVPFAYKDKLKEELHLLQGQHINTPVTETHGGVHQLCLPVRKVQNMWGCVEICPCKFIKFVVRDSYTSLKQ